MNTGILGRIAAMVVLSATLGACAGTGEGTVSAKSGESCPSGASGIEVTNIVEDAMKVVLESEPVLWKPNQTPAKTRLDEFLDCYVGPVDPSDADLKALRGHMIVTLIAHYGNYNVTREDYDGQTDDAIELMARIKKADTSLRQISPLMSGGTRVATAWPEYEKRKRIIYVLQAAWSAEKPTMHRAGDFVKNIIGSWGNVAAIAKEALHGALSMIKKAGTMAYYLPALEADTYNSLAKLNYAKQQETLKGSDVRTVWGLWDAKLDEACTSLSKLADIEFDCTP